MIKRKLKASKHISTYCTLHIYSCFTPVFSYSILPLCFQNKQTMAGKSTCTHALSLTPSFPPSFPPSLTHSLLSFFLLLFLFLSLFLSLSPPLSLPLPLSPSLPLSLPLPPPSLSSFHSCTLLASLSLLFCLSGLCCWGPLISVKEGRL